MENTELKYNPTCILTGKKDNLRMYAHRNDSGDMVGWIFLHESVDIKEIDFSSVCYKIDKVQDIGSSEDN